jgi:hypothetical protein
MKLLFYILFIQVFLYGCNSVNTSKKEPVITETNSIIVDSTINSIDKYSHDSKIQVDTAFNNLPDNNKAEKNNSRPVTDWFFSQGEYAYIKIGSTEEEVLDIQGDPTSSYETDEIKIFYWGNSSVTFKHGKVISYYNYNGRLKVFKKKLPK